MCLQEYVLIKYQRLDTNKSGDVFVPFLEFKEQAFSSVALWVRPVMVTLAIWFLYGGVFAAATLVSAFGFSAIKTDFQALRENISKAF